MLLLSICSFITFTSCQDDVIDNGKSTPAPEGAKKALLEAYGLTFENFVTANDVQILNNDTTEISVNKALAEKLGITSFVNHPAVILCTDPYGYDNTYHDSDAQPKAGTRATGEFQYYDAEALAKEGSRASVRRNILSIHEDLNMKTPSAVVYYSTLVSNRNQGRFFESRIFSLTPT